MTALPVALGRKSILGVRSSSGRELTFELRLVPAARSRLSRSFRSTGVLISSRYSTALTAAFWKDCAIVVGWIPRDLFSAGCYMLCIRTDPEREASQQHREGFPPRQRRWSFRLLPRYLVIEKARPAGKDSQCQLRSQATSTARHSRDFCLVTTEGEAHHSRGGMKYRHVLEDSGPVIGDDHLASGCLDLQKYS